MKGVAILGSTGSIGESCLRVIEQQSHSFEVKLMTCHSRVEKLELQAQTHISAQLVVTDVELSFKVSAAMQKRFVFGVEAVCELLASKEIDIVIVGITGYAGLEPIRAAILAGKRVLIANKEALVCAGHLLLQQARQTGAEILPIDSEHNAIFQCLPEIAQRDVVAAKGCPQHLSKLWLTASGGPFFRTSLEELQNVSPQQACNHPNWQMGQKISVDSATLMNKGLEAIEACVLFKIELEQLQIVIHPSSVIHSLVSFADGSTLAQLGCNDMAIPIQYGLNWPVRQNLPEIQNLDLLQCQPFEFYRPDVKKFPCLQLAMECFKSGSASCVALNAANEVAVQAFLHAQIGFMQIYQLCQYVVENSIFLNCNSFESIQQQDLDARRIATHYLSTNS